MTMRELSQLRYLRREVEREHGKMRERHTAEIARLEAYITAVDDSLTRQAFVLRFSEGLSWRAVAYRIGGGNTADGIRMLCVRYLRKNIG